MDRDGGWNDEAGLEAAAGAGFEALRIGCAGQCLPLHAAALIGRLGSAAPDLSDVLCQT